MQNGIQLSTFRNWLHELIDARLLGIYRILFGLFMTYNMFRYFRIGLIENMFVHPRINFSYDGFYWLKPLPEVYLNILLGALLICGCLIAAGIFFKWACRFFAFGYLYLFLLDKSIYNNHIYLFILMAFLLSFTDADKVFSLKAKASAGYLIPRWQQVILQIQIVLVYFFGGIAKLTHDWIFNAEPIRSMVGFLNHEPLLQSFLDNEVAIFMLNYGGLALDLGAPLLLWYKPFRKWSVWLFIVFNFTNSRLFQDIGIFPFVMLVNLILFYEVHELPWLKARKTLVKTKVKSVKSDLSTSTSLLQHNPWTRNLLIGYFIFQLIFPLRGHFLPNPLDWTTIGNRFSWRMKVDTRSTEEMKFYIQSSDFDAPVPVDIHTFINDMQIQNISMDPRSVRDFAMFLEQEAILYQTNDPEIKANIRIQYNGREPVNFVDSLVDLSNVQYTPFKRLSWVEDVPR
ncbi:MAG TPA: HTTM domain-containing protein [Saprospiraceae bacterium]|jgi:vitamin K-dependent gamma-carboxylase-like protein